MSRAAFGPGDGPPEYAFEWLISQSGHVGGMQPGETGWVARNDVVWRAGGLGVYRSALVFRSHSAGLFDVKVEMLANGTMKVTVEPGHEFPEDAYSPLPIAPVTQLWQKRRIGMRPRQVTGHSLAE